MPHDSPSLWERQAGEGPEAFEAFRCYRDLGSQRSLRRVAQELGKSASLISRWAAEHGWTPRINAWEAEEDRARRAAHIESTKELSLRRARALEQQFEVLTLPAVELLRRAEEDPKVLANVDTKTLIALTARCGRPAIQTAEAIDAAHGNGSSTAPCCEHEAARRQAEAMDRGEAEAYLLGR